MKQCPNCKSTYTDESLKFCLADGANLINLSDAEKSIATTNDETIQISSANPLRIDIQRENAHNSSETVFSPAFSPPQTPERKSNWAIISVLSGLLILVLLGFAGIAAFVFFKPESKENKTIVATSPTVNPSPTPDENLKEKVANLEKQIKNQKDQKPTVSPNSLPSVKKEEGTARANSPGDGFLALRSEPNSETGYRIAKIPHDAIIQVRGCSQSSNPGKIKGRWCQIIYNGQEGWAFDAYITFN